MTMRNALLLAASMTFAACSSSSSAGNAKIIMPDIQLQQLVGPAELNYPQGMVDLQFALAVKNNSGEPITLRRVEIMTLGGGGAYTLRREFYNFDKTIGANQTDGVAFWAHAYVRGMSLIQAEPVNVRAVAHFESPSGNFQKIVMERFGQYPGSNDPG